MSLTGHKRRCLLCGWSVRSSSDSGSTCLIELALRADCDARRKGNKAQERCGDEASAQGVRRDKAALSSGCKSHPATAPAGSNRSSQGGNELAEAFGMRVTNW